MTQNSIIIGLGCSHPSSASSSSSSTQSLQSWGRPRHAPNESSTHHPLTHPPIYPTHPPTHPPPTHPHPPTPTLLLLSAAATAAAAATTITTATTTCRHTPLPTTCGQTHRHHHLQQRTASQLEQNRGARRLLLHVLGKLLLSSRWSGASSRWLAWRLERDDVPAQANHPLEEPYLQKSQPSLETVWSKHCQHERYCCMLDCSRCLRLPTMRRSEKRPAQGLHEKQKMKSESDLVWST